MEMFNVLPLSSRQIIPSLIKHIAQVETITTTIIPFVFELVSLCPFVIHSYWNENNSPLNLNTSLFRYIDGTHVALNHTSKLYKYLSQFDVWQRNDDMCVCVDNNQCFYLWQNLTTWWSKKKNAIFTIFFFEKLVQNCHISRKNFWNLQI
jgi:hypothetical protein